MSMDETPYSQLPGKELILRDYLAAQRTALANDRTILAYIRTALTFLIGGVTFIQFFDAASVRAMGWVFLPLAAMVLVIGSAKYLRAKHALAHLGDGQGLGVPPSPAGDADER